MTQKESIEEALRILGGRAHTGMIYPLAIKLGNFSGSKNKEATIRNCLLTNPGSFRRSPGKPRGWWELVSFQEEVADMKKRIEALEAENERLKAVPTEDDFVKRLVKESKKLYKHDNDKIEVIRQMLYNLGCTEAEEELDAWIEGREYKPSMNIEGDYVVTKHVGNEVNGVAKGATGIITNK